MLILAKSVCGEMCPSKDYCPECGTDDKKALRVDLILLQTLSEWFADPDTWCVVLALCLVFIVPFFYV